MLVLKQRPRFTSPRLRGEVGLRSNPGEGDSPRARCVESPPHPNPLPDASRACPTCANQGCATGVDPGCVGERENTVTSGGTMLRLVAASLATILISALPANAEE